MDCIEKGGERAIYHCNTVESPAAKHSRHEIQDFGQTWDTFNTQRFDAYANDITWRFQNNPMLDNAHCDLWFNHPTRGPQTRADGVSWCQTKELWKEFGPISDKIENGVTGDVSYMDKMYDAGVPGYLCLRSTAYHLVASESREIQGHAG